jgi:hypothetical protein
MNRAISTKFRFAVLTRFASADLKAFLLPIALLLVPVLSSCTGYDIEDAVSDQKQFNQAFRDGENEAMRVASERFRKNFEARRVTDQSDRYGCTANALASLEYDVPKVHKIALDWASNKSEKLVLKTWDMLDERDEVLARRNRDCAGKDLPELNQLTELIALVRTDLRENYDLDALFVAEKKMLEQRRANCDLEEPHKKLIFQSFVRLEDVYGLSGRQRVISEVAKDHKISEDCVDRVARNATFDHPEWIPDPL